MRAYSAACERLPQTFDSAKTFYGAVVERVASECIEGVGRINYDLSLTQSLDSGVEDTGIYPGTVFKYLHSLAFIRRAVICDAPAYCVSRRSVRDMTLSAG